jgi:hypothetical protein
MSKSSRPPCSDRKKLSSVGFKPALAQSERQIWIMGTPHEVELIPEETVHERILEITTGCQHVSNLRDQSETDFDSVVLTTWLRLIKMNVRRIP